MDVFSYGLLLHYCLTGGRHPFGARYERDMNILQVLLHSFSGLSLHPICVQGKMAWSTPRHATARINLLRQRMLSFQTGPRNLLDAGSGQV